MVEEQGGVCAACRVDKPAHVDHDHATGLVRGMLCFLCNQALGNVRDDVRRLQGLIDYLVRAADRRLNIETFDLTPYNVEVDTSRFHQAA